MRVELRRRHTRRSLDRDGDDPEDEESRPHVTRTRIGRGRLARDEGDLDHNVLHVTHSLRFSNFKFQISFLFLFSRGRCEGMIIPLTSLAVRVSFLLPSRLLTSPSYPDLT